MNTINKLIRIADKSVAGWNTVDEYLTELASDSDDEKRMRQAEARPLRKKKAKLESYNRAKSSISTTSFKTSGQTASANVFPKRTGQANRSFRPSYMSSKNNKHPDRRTFALDAASKAIGENTALHNVGKGATQKATNTEVNYDNNHFVSGDCLDTDDRNVEFEQGSNKQWAIPFFILTGGWT